MSGIFRKSFGEDKKIRGYVIKRMPIGAFMKAMDRLQAVPGELINACFPGMSLMEIGRLMSTQSTEALQLAIGGLLRAAPEYLLDVLSTLFEIDRERLENDPAIGLDGLMEMLQTWIDINGLVGFTKAAKGIVKTLKTLMRPKENTEASSD